MPKNWQPTSSNFKVTFPTKTTNAYTHPRVCQKDVSFVSPFSKEGMERTKEKERKEAEAHRYFVETMALLHTRFEEEQKDVCIISLDKLKLEEEVKNKEVDDVEEDIVNLQEELLEEVNELPSERLTKVTEKLVQRALQSADIIKSSSKLSPAS